MSKKHLFTTLILLVVAIGLYAQTTMSFRITNVAGSDSVVVRNADTSALVGQYSALQSALTGIRQVLFQVTPYPDAVLIFGEAGTPFDASGKRMVFYGSEGWANVTITGDIYIDYLFSTYVSLIEVAGVANFYSSANITFIPVHYLGNEVVAIQTDNAASTIHITGGTIISSGAAVYANRGVIRITGGVLKGIGNLSPVIIGQGISGTIADLHITGGARLESLGGAPAIDNRRTGNNSNIWIDNTTLFTAGTTNPEEVLPRTGVVRYPPDRTAIIAWDNDNEERTFINSSTAFLYSGSQMTDEVRWSRVGLDGYGIWFRNNGTNFMTEFPVDGVTVLVTPAGANTVRLTNYGENQVVVKFEGFDAIYNIYPSISTAFNALRDIRGADVNIIFGDTDDTPLTVSSGVLMMNSGANRWGNVNLSGNIVVDASTASTDLFSVQDIDTLTTTANITIHSWTSAFRCTEENGTIHMAGGEILTRRYAIDMLRGHFLMTDGLLRSSESFTIQTSHLDISTVTIAGGRVENTSQSAPIYHNAAGLLTIAQADSTIPTVITASALYSDRGTINITNWVNSPVQRLLVTGGTISAVNGSAIRNASNGSITIQDGYITASGTSSYTRAIRVVGSGALTINGGTIENTYSVAVHTEGGDVTINGGEIFGQQIAIQSTTPSSVITITDGLIQSNSNWFRTIQNQNSGGLNISGGVIFNRAASHTNSVVAPLEISSNAPGTTVILAWDGNAGQRVYVKDTEVHLSAYPRVDDDNRVVAVWDTLSGESGIAYVSMNGENAGFLVIPEVNVVIPSADPFVVLLPGSHDFEQVWCGEEALFTFDIENYGTTDLVITAIEVDDFEDFERFSIIPAGVTGLPVTLETGDVHSFTVKYIPMNIDGDFARIMITTNDPLSPVSYASVRGEGKGYTTFPQFEGFETSADPFVAHGWGSITDPLYNSATIFRTPQAAHTGNNGVRMNKPFDWDIDYTVILRSPYITDLDTREVSFWAHGDQAFDSSLLVGTMTDPFDYTTFTMVDSLALTGDTYEDFTISFRGATGNFIAFQVLKNTDSNTQVYVFLDDITISTIPEPVFAIDTQLLTFPLFVANDTTFATVTISNDSTAMKALEINWTLPAGVTTTVEPDTISIAPGDFRTIEFELTTTTAGIYTDEIEITTNQYNLPVFTLPVTAIVVPELTTPVSLVAEQIGHFVKITWEAPEIEAVYAPTAYQVLAGDSLMTTVEDMDYTYYNAEVGSYLYGVKAIYHFGDFEWISEADTFRLEIEDITPAYPAVENLFGEQIMRDVVLTWEAPADTAMTYPIYGYNVYVDSFLVNTEIVVNAIFVHANNATGSYLYEIETIYAFADSVWYGERDSVRVEVIEFISIMTPPQNLIATQEPGRLRINLTWEPPLPSEYTLEGYAVYCDTILVSTEVHPDTTFSFTVAANDIYYIEVVAVYLEGGSLPAAEYVIVENGVGDTDIVAPVVTGLSGNYPNPFNPSTTIAFSIGTASNAPVGTQHAVSVQVDIYNIKGQKVRSLVNDMFGAGTHTVVWNGADDNGRSVSSGVYFYRMKTEGFVQSKKMLLLK